jgi:SAM-dependent methyltransferase
LTNDSSLLSRESHFDFGKNWASYASNLKPELIEEALKGMRRLVGESLAGKTFLDIGCGSGLHSLAALRLGAARVVAVDLDSDSVATTRKVLSEHAASQAWEVREISVFDLNSATLGHFDVVYSWGVLHHTGDMYRAMRTASAMVSADGQFVFALYRLTRMCGFWKKEKRWYASASASKQRAARAVYRFLFRLAMGLQGRSFASYVANYRSNRGMDFEHDVHDWMGGWPYESITPQQVHDFMTPLGFTRRAQFVESKIQMGLAGSGCDEYVYAKNSG